LKFIRRYNSKFLRTDGEIAAHGLGEGESLPSGPLRHYEGKTANRFIAFEKPAGITSLTIRVFSPINGTSTYDANHSNSAVNNVYRIGLRKTHEWTAGTEKRTIENITVKSTNTDKSLTSADVPEIRRSQIQTIYFSGFQAVTHTGNFSSDYSIGGSGIVTQIFTDTQTQRQLDFDNYVITGYNAASVIGELSDDENEYSSDYENISGADLVWSIEPRINDMTLNRDYTLDPEFASGHAQQYKVININENENKYDIVALEHTPIKFDNLGEGDDPADPPSTDPGPGGPPENPTLEEEEGPNKPGPGTEDPDPPIPGEDGACCGEIGGVKTCYNDYKRSQCEELDEKLKPGGSATFHKDKTCDQIDCKPPIVINNPVIPIEPIVPPEDNIEQFINLNFKIAADFTQISHFGGGDIDKYKLKMFTDDEAHKNNLMGISSEDDYRVALGKYYDHLGCINISPSCADQNLEQYTLESYGCDEEFKDVQECCFADQYAEKVKQYGSNFVICKTAIFGGGTEPFKWMADDECSRIKNKCK